MAELCPVRREPGSYVIYPLCDITVAVFTCLRLSGQVNAVAMKKTKLLTGVALAWALTGICSAQTTTTTSSTSTATGGSTAPYTEGPVWDVTMVRTKYGMDDDY